MVDDEARNDVRYALFDSHTHLNDPALYGEAAEVVERARAAGVSRMVVPGYDRAACERALELAARFEEVYAAVGFHPSDAQGVTDRDLADLETWCALPQVVAVGEIGLDNHYETPGGDVQARVFAAQLQLARRADLPVIIHDREAHADILAALRDSGIAQVGGVLHSFSGGIDMMREAVALNFHIGLGGPVTFRNAKKPVQIAANVPVERLLIETDAPWLTPEPHRGKRNEPAHVRLVAERIAEVRGAPLRDIAAQTYRNADNLFKNASLRPAQQSSRPFADNPFKRVADHATD